MTFKGHSGPNVCPLQEQATVILQNFNEDTVGSQRCFLLLERKENFTLQVHCATPDIDGSYIL